MDFHIEFFFLVATEIHVEGIWWNSLWMKYETIFLMKYLWFIPEYKHNRFNVGEYFFFFLNLPVDKQLAENKLVLYSAGIMQWMLSKYHKVFNSYFLVVKSHFREWLLGSWKCSAWNYMDEQNWMANCLSDKHATLKPSPSSQFSQCHSSQFFQMKLVFCSIHSTNFRSGCCENYFWNLLDKYLLGGRDMQKELVFESRKCTSNVSYQTLYIGHEEHI